MIRIHYNGERSKFIITCPEFDMRAKEAPDSKYDKFMSAWILHSTGDNVTYLKAQYDSKYFTPDALARVMQQINTTPKPMLQFPSDHVFKNPPMEKQWDALHKAWTEPACALFMEMGTGKSFIGINIGAARFLAGNIQAIVVLCPTSVKPVWEIEFEKHYPGEYDMFVLESGQVRKAELFMQALYDDKPKVLIVGVEALSQGGAAKYLARFVLNHNCMIICDESSRIKNPTASRTKKAIAASMDCEYKLIMTGTPITQGMHDLYSQYRFLDWRIIGQKSYYTFKNRYCIMGGYGGHEILGYVNQDELLDAVSETTVLIKKEEMMDLPPKVYESIIVQPNPAQAKALEELGDPYLMATEIDGKILEVETILERMTRYQQIVGGHFPFEEFGESDIMPFPGTNPKMKALMELIEELPNDKKVIIWARFIPEILLIMEALGDEAVAFYGATPQSERKKILQDFQTPGGPRFFVSNPSMGGIGITLTEATYTIYYSNTFSLEDRLQSEDRNHRKGQEHKVTYIDITMNHKIDKAMIFALKRKKSIADYVTEEIKARATL